MNGLAVGSTVAQAVPLLRVADVGRTIAWYRDVLGFVGDPFPAQPPYLFAILRHGPVEIMVRHTACPPSRTSGPHDWDIYLRLDGGGLRTLFAELQARGVVTRRLERMFYGQVEFEITDPDGHVLCLSECLDDASDLPTPAEA